MSGTTTPICVISSTGIFRPAFQDVLAYFTAQAQAIWGADVYLGNDSPDGQWVALQAKSLDDANAMCVAVYNAFSPATATGMGLSSVVKINGLMRDIPSYSSVDLAIGGSNGTQIFNGAASDGTYTWSFPATVTIPASGTITVTAICTTAGAITANPGTITTRSAGLTQGWQTVNNPAAATPGQPVELDPALRLRQAVSTAIPSQTLLDGIVGAIESIPGVVRVKPYENDTASTDANGIPSHSMALVVDGGNAQTIANTIGVKKGTGAGTYGTTSETYLSPQGTAKTINFFRPTTVPFTVIINISTDGLTGYTSAIGAEIQNAVLAYMLARPIGGDSGFVRWSRLQVPAQLAGPYASPASPNDSSTYEVTSILIARNSNSPTQADVALAFNEAVAMTLSSITINVS